MGGKINFENNKVRAVSSDSLTPISQKYSAYDVFAGIGDSTAVFVEGGYQFRVNDSLRAAVLQKVSTAHSFYAKSR